MDNLLQLCDQIMSKLNKIVRNVPNTLLNLCHDVKIRSNPVKHLCEFRSGNLDT